MGWNYNPLWILLIKNGMKKTDLKDVIGISPSTLAKLSKNEVVSMDILDKLCVHFNCRIEDIVEYVHEKKEPSE